MTVSISGDHGTPVQLRPLHDSTTHDSVFSSDTQQEIEEAKTFLRGKGVDVD